MTKQTIQLDLSVDHVPGAAGVAQKAESGGVLSKTSVNNHLRRVSRKREVYCVYIQVYCLLRSRRCTVVVRIIGTLSKFHEFTLTSNLIANSKHILACCPGGGLLARNMA